MRRLRNCFDGVAVTYLGAVVRRAAPQRRPHCSAGVNATRTTEAAAEGGDLDGLDGEAPGGGSGGPPGRNREAVAAVVAAAATAAAVVWIRLRPQLRPSRGRWTTVA